MPRHIIHHDGWFFEWSTIVDDIITCAMTQEEFVLYYQEEYPEPNQMQQRMQRALEKGTSSMLDSSAEDTCTKFVQNDEDKDDEPKTVPFAEILQSAIDERAAFGYPVLQPGEQHSAKVDYDPINERIIRKAIMQLTNTPKHPNYNP